MSKRKSLFKASVAWLTMAFLVISTPGLGSFAQASQSTTAPGDELFQHVTPPGFWRVDCSQLFGFFWSRPKRQP